MKTTLLLPLLLFLPFAVGAQTLTLEDAWGRALASNPGEEAARARLEQARARFDQVRGARQPSLSLEAGGSRISYSDNARAQIPGSPESTELYSTRLSAGWLIWDNGALRSNAEAAGLEADATSADRMDAREELLAEVGRAFTAAQLARASLRIAEEDRAFQERQLDHSRRKEAAGLDSRGDRLNFEIRKLAAENAAVLGASDYEGALAVLAALLGMPEGELPPPPAEPDAAALGAPERLPELEILWAQAQASLPALERAQLRVESAAAAVAARRGERGPRLSLFGNLGVEREEDPEFSGDDLGNVAGVQIAWDLWDGQTRRAAVREAEAQLQEAEAGMQQTRLEAQSRLRQAHAAYGASVESEILAARGLELSRENRELIEASYQAGRETLLRLNEAQRDFNTAGLRYAEAKLRRQLAWIRTLRALGGLRGQLPQTE